MRKQERGVFCTRAPGRWKIALLLTALALGLGATLFVAQPAMGQDSVNVHRVEGVVQIRFPKGKWENVLTTSRFIFGYGYGDAPCWVRTLSGIALIQRESEFELGGYVFFRLGPYSQIKLGRLPRQSFLQILQGKIQAIVLQIRGGYEWKLIEPTAVNSIHGTEFNVSVPPDYAKTRLAYTSYDSSSGTNYLGLVKGDGSGAHSVLNLTTAIGPAWLWPAEFSISPDGRRIAFEYARGDIDVRHGPDIYVVNADGTNLRVLSIPYSGQYHPHISPDGRWVAFSSNYGCIWGVCGGFDGVGLWDLDTDTLYTLDPEPSTVVWGFSAGGERLAVQKSDGKLYALGLDGFTREELFDWAAFAAQILPPDSVVYPVLSPDWSQIAFIAKPSGGSFGIYLVNLDGTDFRQVIALTYSSGYPTFGPDGQRLAFTEWDGQTARVAVVNTDGTGYRTLLSTNDPQRPSWSGFLESVVQVYEGEVEVRRNDDPSGTPTTVSAAQQTRVDVADGTGEVEPPRAFPLPPEICAKEPSEGAVLADPPVLAWCAAAGADYYTIDLFGPGVPAAPWVPAGVTEYALASDWGAMGEGSWQWRVDAFDAQYNLIARTPWRSFRKETGAAPRIVRLFPKYAAISTTQPLLGIEFSESMDTASVEQGTVSLAATTGTVFSGRIADLAAGGTFTVAWNTPHSTLSLILATPLTIGETYTFTYEGSAARDLSGLPLVAPPTDSAGFTVAAPVDETGGIVKVPGGWSVVVPSGALGGPVNIAAACQQTSPGVGGIVTPQPAPQGHQILNLCDWEPSGLQFTQATKICYPDTPYDNDSIWALVGGTTWVQLVTYKEGGAICTDSTHFSNYATFTEEEDTPPGIPRGLAAAPAPEALDVTWEANPEADLAGYKIYLGTASGTYTETYDVGSRSAFRINGLSGGVMYYLALSAYDVANNESAKSAEVSAQPTVPPGSCLGAGSSRLMGQVKSGRKGIADVTLTLSGPEGCSDGTTTNAKGKYQFLTLASGTYTVTPSQEGCTFDPPSRTVTIGGRTAKANFTGTCP